MKKYTVRIYNYYNNVVQEFHHNSFEVAKRCARRFVVYWADIIDNEFNTLYIYDERTGEERYYNTELIAL